MVAGGWVRQCVRTLLPSPVGAWRLCAQLVYELYEDGGFPRSELGQGLGGIFGKLFEAGDACQFFLGSCVPFFTLRFFFLYL